MNDAETFQLESEIVDWLGALWQLADKNPSKSANPSLVLLLKFTTEIQKHPAFAYVEQLQESSTRDHVIKDVVRSLLGTPGQHPELTKLLLDLVARAPEIVGNGVYQVIEQSRDDARSRLEEIAGRLDPAEDIFELTGEHVDLQVVASPSLFLPPPQAGRHGVLVHGDNNHKTAFLHFGFPLQGDPAAYSITKPWLIGGAWHYAIDIFLSRYWPEIELRLEAEEELGVAIAQALGLSTQATRNGDWKGHIKSHINVTMKCLMSVNLGISDGVHRALAKARNLRLFPWFEQWLTDRDEPNLGKLLLSLPEAMSAQRSSWEESAAAQAATSLPPSVNLALLSTSAQQANLVVPDAWSDETALAAAAGWRLLPLPLLRYSEWLNLHPDEAASPTIAIGEPENHPLVKRVLEERGLVLDDVEAKSPAIMALSSPETELPTWCLAVAVSHPDTAASLRMELALKQTSSYVIFDRDVVLSADRVSLRELLA